MLFTATQPRGGRVLSTCLSHIVAAWEPGTIVTFSCGAVHGHSPFPKRQHNYRIVLWRSGSAAGVGAELLACWETGITVLWLCTFPLPFYEKGRFGLPSQGSLGHLTLLS